MLAAGNGGFTFADGAQFRFGGFITSRLHRGDGDHLAGHLEFQPVAGFDASLALNCGGHSDTYSIFHGDGHNKNKGTSEGSIAEGRYPSRCPWVSICQVEEFVRSEERRVG